MKIFLTLSTFFLFLLLVGKYVSSQHCGCKSNECCSRFGYCGTNDDYCGSDCWSGACKGRNNVKVGDIVTHDFFNVITANLDDFCAGKGFYTRSKFLEAFATWSAFGTIGSVHGSKREIAAFFAHVAHETGRMCFVEEDGGRSKTYCDELRTDWPCDANKSYYGRGPLQLKWNYYYGIAGKVIGFDGLKNPDILVKDPLLSIKVSVWFWMQNAHGVFVKGNGFGDTIRNLNDEECDGGSAAKVNSRVNYYKDYCRLFGVDPGENLRC